MLQGSNSQHLDHLHWMAAQHKSLMIYPIELDRVWWGVVHEKVIHIAALRWLILLLSLKSWQNKKKIQVFLIFHVNGSQGPINGLEWFWSTISQLGGFKENLNIAMGCCWDKAIDPTATSKPHKYVSTFNSQFIYLWDLYKRISVFNWSHFTPLMVICLHGDGCETKIKHLRKKPKHLTLTHTTLTHYHNHSTRVQGIWYYKISLLFSKVSIVSFILVLCINL